MPLDAAPAPEEGAPHRVLVVNPNTSDEMTAAIHRAACGAAPPGVLVETVRAESGPRSIEGHFDEAVSALATLEPVLRRQHEADAFVLACFSAHIGIDAAREVTRKPVVGIAEAGMALATFLGRRFSIVTTSPRWRPILEDAVRLYGYESRCASVRSSGLAVLELERLPHAEVVERLTTEAERAVCEDGAEAIVLGCAGMADLETRLRAALDVPIVESVAAGVGLACTLARLGLGTSARGTYAPVQPREVAGELPAAVRRVYEG
ncbi:MAG: aspartate/glutamate racemase family protein [Chloroflexi bacterium]|nr:aspartate/glutamate racemase family protein [Chloroflexota bacterium]